MDSCSVAGANRCLRLKTAASRKRVLRRRVCSPTLCSVVPMSASRTYLTKSSKSTFRSSACREPFYAKLGVDRSLELPTLRSTRSFAPTEGPSAGSAMRSCTTSNLRTISRQFVSCDSAQTVTKCSWWRTSVTTPASNSPNGY